MTAVQDILRSLGITRCYKGFKHTEYAICLAIQDESRLEAITKEIYMETAEHFECNWTAVERNIRTAVSRAWSVNPALPDGRLSIGIGTHFLAIYRDNLFLHNSLLPAAAAYSALIRFTFPTNSYR